MVENINTLQNWNNLITYYKVENNLNAPLLGKMKDKKNILSKPISEFEFSVRTSNCLKNDNITTLGQIAELSEKYLLAIPNFGKVGLEEIKSLLNKYGLKLDTNINWSNLEPIIREPIVKKPVIFEEKLFFPIDRLELSVRSMNCLKNDNIICFGDLVRKTESEILRTTNIGRKSLNEIKEVLDGMALSLGMEIPNWPPDNYNERVKNYNINNLEQKDQPFQIKLDFETLMSLNNKKFNDREKIIYKKRFCENKTLSHVGKIFNVTRERVRQIEAKMIRRTKKRYKESYKKFLSHERNYIFSKMSGGKNLITFQTLKNYKKQNSEVLTEKDLFINFCIVIIYEDFINFLNNEFYLVNKSQFIRRKTAGRSRVNIINAWRKEPKQIDNKIKINSGVFKLFSNNYGD